ncbi:MAG: 1-acyl-sn-glycerol-3-phosphate acyltransferase [Sandaracinaceae bacterium]|jgi:glycerol-3-phosphate O-acyltransferase|nr:1-acyl-sn-glycerol-3-phosphate acyltransferase [Sandaracinaceae bacterium]
MKNFLQRPLRLPRLRPYVPEPDDPPIFWFNSERDEIVREVVRRVVEHRSKSSGQMEYTLNEVAFHEVERLEKQKDSESRESLGKWRGLLRRVSRMNDDERRDALREIALNMAKDVAGNFDPRVYAFAGHAVPRLLTAVMKPASLPLALVSGAPEALDKMLITEGCIPKLRRLAQIGTLIFVPTHSSNLDSVALGYALMREGLPPVSYGAGKNLFTNPIISFFMHNLGAYRLDRRIKATLYKDVLKTYSTVMIERGYHSLFFPGGTRSRSNLIETHLKLGLAGTGIEAFARNQARGVKRPVFFVPTTINYALVLEAETLIEDHLKEHGKARYIIEDDEFSQIDRWIDFFRRLTALASACVIRFGEPVDPFGNDIDDDGRSISPNGQVIDPSTYVMTRGEVKVDGGRDAAYTKELGETIAKRFLSDTVIMSSQLVAHVLFRALVKATPGVDLFGRLRYRGEVSMPIDDLYREIGEARDALIALEQQGQVRVSPSLRNETPEYLVDRSIAFWDGYHTRIVARRSGTDMVAEDPTLLLYYQNRLVPYAQRIAPADLHDVATEIVRMERR